MGDTYQSVIDLAFAELDLQDDVLETKFKTLLAADVKTLIAAQVVDQQKGDTDVAPYLKGLRTIARVVGSAAVPLSDETVGAVQEAIAEIVDVKDQPLLSGALEEIFSGYLGIIRGAKELKTYIDGGQPA